MYENSRENCDCFQFHDVTMTQMLGCAFTSARIITNSLLLHTWRTFPSGKNGHFLTVGNCNNVVSEILCWHKKMTVGLLAASARAANKINLNSSKERYTASLRRNLPLKLLVLFVFHILI